jgi:hypothetical protein
MNGEGAVIVVLTAVILVLVLANLALDAVL